MTGTVAVVFGGIFLTVVTPVWIVFNYLGKRRASGGLSADNEARLAALWASADAMEARVEALEKVVGVMPDPSKRAGGPSHPFERS